MSYVFPENRKSLRKGFEVVMMAIETGESSEILIFVFYFDVYCRVYKAIKMFASLNATAFKGSELNACSLFES